MRYFVFFLFFIGCETTYQTSFFHKKFNDLSTKKASDSKSPETRNFSYIKDKKIAFLPLSSKANSFQDKKAFASIEAMSKISLEKSKLFSSIFTSETIELWLNENTKLKVLFNDFWESLRIGHRIDANFLMQLTKEKNIDFLVLLGFDQWECYECSKPKQIKFRVDLIDVKSQTFIWTFLKQSSSPETEIINSDKIKLQFKNIIKEMVLEFELKWHQKQFDSLKRFTT